MDDLVLKLFCIFLLPIMYILLLRKRTLLLALSTGAGAALLALLVISLLKLLFSWMYSSIPQIFWNITTIMVEELAKFFLLHQFISRYRERLELVAIALGLGFACVETVLHISLSIEIIILRLVATSLLHIATMLILTGVIRKTTGSQWHLNLYTLRIFISLPIQILLHVGYNEIF